MDDDDSVVSGFISALHSFSKMLSAGDLNEIKLGSLSFFLTNQSDFVFAVSADDDRRDVNKTKLGKIAVLFTKLYSEPHGSADKIARFKEHLVEEGILERNCGKHEDCADCENSRRSLPVAEMRRELEA